MSIILIGPILFLAIVLQSWDPIILIAFKNPSSVATVPIVIPDL